MSQFQELVICHFDLHAQNMIFDGRGNVHIWPRNVHPAFAQGLLRLMDDGQFKEEIQQPEDIGFALSTGPFSFIDQPGSWTSQIPRLAGHQLADQLIHGFAHLMQRGHGQLSRSRESVGASDIRSKKTISSYASRTKACRGKR
ncbi:hypothetical protein VC83_04993 [Pseudogymnoascus destructans]|uniref:Uncharacterized protein n=1 Tax=Pseudogymnoascus destructans TaxID=655981 RepID=A0A177A8G9_9PEZI|nr:uncharacterized protein VC83_04993 [Pseudogymnoascus destructans]OAF58446.1 hypothetical protein VC83_04993 [Pseudogymnoascus destructans]